MYPDNRKFLIFLFFIGILLAEFAYGQNNSNDDKNTDIKASEAVKIERVSGIGGFFIRTNNPDQISEWYEKHLGVNRRPQSYEEDVWQQEAGPTVFAPFNNDTEYFGRPSQSWMINFRVKDLDAMVQQLKQSGIEVIVDEKIYPNGRFARLYDPEGNPIELWEPK